MESSIGRIRKAVKREDAEQYLVITLLSFAASVILIRLFLELTGYPQVGNSELHIAHVLWGGLLLFVASLLPLVFANRWVYKARALLVGGWAVHRRRGQVYHPEQQLLLPGGSADHLRVLSAHRIALPSSASTTT